MGSNPTQAVGLLVFLIAFVLFAAALYGGSVLPAIPGVALLAGSAALFRKARPWEQ